MNLLGTDKLETVGEKYMGSRSGSVLSTATLILSALMTVN